MTTPAATPRLEVQGLTKVFGPRPQAVLAALQSEAQRSGAQRSEAGRAERGPGPGTTGPGGRGEGRAQAPRHTVAVRDVSFAVAAGETFVVMGLSGSGKSTLVRCINRLIEPTAGTVAVDGQDVTAMDRERLLQLRRHKVTMVFQGFGLFPHRTVADNVAYGLEVRGVRRADRQAKAERMLETVGLKDWGDHYPDELSGGMRQRVGLARALATDPEILLMDEPFSALDPLIRRRMQDELLDLQERLRKTILFITHDLDEALRLGNRIAIMKAGRIVQVGRPEEILRHPADDYVASFVRHVDRSKVLRASDAMAPPQPLLRLGHAPHVALREMELSGLSSAFVVGPQLRLAGLLTVEAAIAAARRGDADLREAVEDGVHRVSPDQSLRDLIPVAVAAPYPLAVVDAQGRLLGIVARVAILRALAEEAAPVGRAEGGDGDGLPPGAQESEATAAVR